MEKTTQRQTTKADHSKPVKRGKPRQRSRGAPNTSDTADARWTVRGVPSNVRDMAVAGAKARGMTVGDYLAELIVLNRKGHPADKNANVPAMPMSDMVGLLQSLNERLTKMEQEKSRSFLGSLFGGQNVGQKAA